MIHSIDIKKKHLNHLFCNYSSQSVADSADFGRTVFGVRRHEPSSCLFIKRMNHMNMTNELFNVFWLLCQYSLRQKAEILYITTVSFRMTHFPSSTHVINAVKETHGTALTCVCRRWRGARSFTFEDLCFPLWFSELLRIKDCKIFLVYCGFYCLQLLPWPIPAYEAMWLTVFEMIAHCQSPNISLVCLCLSLCLSPSHPTPAWNRRCPFPLDTLRDKLKCR